MPPIKNRGESWETVFDDIAAFYKTDLDPYRLRVHLRILSSTCPGNKESVGIGYIRKYLQDLSPSESMQEIVFVMQLILVMPSTNAVSERSFSALQRLKTYLRDTKQNRLSHFLLLHIHKEHTDALSFEAVAGLFYFVGSSEHRMSVLGKFMRRA